jgi:NAD(P)-dependent dehydrogenase (short-subunit alcohol dehydrogenase family)
MEEALMSDSKQQTFLVTGVSTGLGRAFATAALDAGHTVIGTVRKPDDAEGYEALVPARAHARLLDVTDDHAVAEVIAEAESSVGPIDVLIANAGYGHEGILEESSMADLRHQFDVNVFGTVAVIKAVLPGMRIRRSGHIFCVTSMGGLVTFPGLAYYHGSKFALEGILEALGKEVAGFGIHVTAIEPGSFRTDWAGRSMVRTERSIPDYDEMFDPLRAARQKINGQQLGDPAKAGAAVLAVLGAPRPPAHLVLGSDALRLIGAGRSAVDADIRDWDSTSRSTDFADGQQIA